MEASWHCATPRARALLPATRYQSSGPLGALLSAPALAGGPWGVRGYRREKSTALGWATTPRPSAPTSKGFSVLEYHGNTSPDKSQNDAVTQTRPRSVASGGGDASAVASADSATPPASPRPTAAAPGSGSPPARTARCAAPTWPPPSSTASPGSKCRVAVKPRGARLLATEGLTPRCRASAHAARPISHRSRGSSICGTRGQICEVDL